jgi:hypothetical protein
MLINVFLWLVPLLILPVSWLFYKYLPLRRPRYIVYAVALAAAFMLDIFNVSFRFSTAGTCVRMAVCFILAEYFWNIGRVVKGKTFRLLMIVALCSYGVYYRHWIAAGPSSGWNLWKQTVLSEFRVETSEYRVIDKDLCNRFHPARDIKLLKRIGSLPMEKLVKAYRTPGGYYKTVYTCKWSIQPLGVRMDLYDNDRKEWTLGEGY